MSDKLLALAALTIGKERNVRNVQRDLNSPHLSLIIGHTRTMAQLYYREEFSQHFITTYQPVYRHNAEEYKKYTILTAL
jgi:hypothetical protein